MEIDLSRLDARSRAVLDESFKDTFHQNLRQAMVNQTQAAQRNHNGTPWKQDFGPKLTEIDPLIDALWTAQYGHNYRENPDLMRWLMARNEEIRAKAVAPKPQVGWRATLDKRGCRFGRNTIQFAS